MKRVFKIALFCCLVCCALCVCACGKDKSKDATINWDGLTIANFDSYQYIGVSPAQENISAQTVSLCKSTNLASNLATSGEGGEVVIQDAPPEEPVKLVGITGASECEEMHFVNSKGDISKQNAHLIRLDTYEKYSFAIFSTKTSKYKEKSWGLDFDETEYRFFHKEVSIYRRNKGGLVGSDDFREDIKPYFIIIDNSNGNLYSMNDIRDRILKQEGEKNFISIKILSDSLHRDFIMFDVETHAKEGYGFDHTLYQIKFNDNNIEVVERMNNTQIKNFLGGVSAPEYLTFDQFGNVFRTRKYNGTSWEYEYFPKNGSRFQKSDGTFATLNFTDERYPGRNDIVTYTFFNHFLIRRTYKESYSDNANLETVSYLNGQGEFVPTSMDLPNTWGDLDNMYHEGRVYYRVTSDGFTSGEGTYRQTITLTKIILDEENSWDCEIENILLEDEWFEDYYTNNQTAVRNDELVKNCTFGNGFMYTYYNTDFYIYNLKTGEKTIINNYEEIKKVYYDEKLGVVKSIFIDSTSMENVTGYFTLNNELIIENLSSLNYRNKRVFVIKPLNK